MVNWSWCKIGSFTLYKECLILLNLNQVRLPSSKQVVDRSTIARYQLISICSENQKMILSVVALYSNIMFRVAGAKIIISIY